MNESESKEVLEMLKEAPHMQDALDGQDAIIKVLTEWKDRIDKMDESGKTRFLWAANDALICASYRILGMRKMNLILATILAEVREGEY